MSTHIPSQKTSKCPIDPSDPSNYLLLQAVTSTWNDGILILTTDGQVVYGNRAGWNILSRFHPHIETLSPKHLPQEIKQALNALKHEHHKDSSPTQLLESEFKTDPHHTYRMRMRWFDVAKNSQPHILVVLEDQYQSKYNLAMAEAKRYQLSSREADVWRLYRLGYQYKQIAAELFITTHTVKKHLRNIRWKREYVENQAAA